MNMEGRAVIAWTPENWLTILLMVAVGFTVVGFGARILYRFKGGSDAA